MSGTKERGKKKQKLRNKERKYVKGFERVRELTVYSDRVTSESAEEESELKTLILEDTKKIIFCILKCAMRSICLKVLYI